MVIIGAALCVVSFAILFVEAIIGLNFWHSFIIFLIIISVYISYLFSV